METIEYRTLDKSTWGSGLWQDEPDKKQWPDPATGLPCLAVRNSRSGNWCGYVGVAEGHPWHGLDYTDCALPTAAKRGQKAEDAGHGEWYAKVLAERRVCGEETYCDHRPESIVDVHGGLTFAAACSPSDTPDRGICHIAGPGEPEHVWWFGFDCAHACDVSPAREARDPMFREPDSTYRSLAYVERECTKLAAQLAQQP